MGETARNLELGVVIDKQFIGAAFCAGQKMTWHPQIEGHAVNYKRIRRLILIYQKPDTSRPAKGHKAYLCLLGGLHVKRPNTVWCANVR